jgi:hypothetical protein
MGRPTRNREELAGQRRRDAPCEPGDELVGEWKRSELEAMDARFRQALERGFTQPGKTADSA